MNNSSVFPSQHTTVTTTTITNAETQVNPTIRFDKEYLNTLSGQLRLVEIIASCIALLLVSFSDVTLSNTGTLFETVAVSAIWFNTILLVFYLFHVIERFYKIPWLKVEVISCIAFAAFYFLTSLLAVTLIFSRFMFFFVMVASVSIMFIFGYDAYLKLQALQSGDIAQGARVVSVTEVNQPQYRY